VALWWKTKKARVPTTDRNPREWVMMNE
jgi:hypothetical protein